MWRSCGRGDFVIVQFGHNDAANSQNYPDRISIKGNSEETQEIESPVTHRKEVIHTYGWYLRQYVKDVRSKGATIIICSPVPRNTWIEGRIKRGLDGYAQWAAEAAKQSGALFLDLNTIAANRYDALGQERARPYFNDQQHTTKFGARLNAEAVIEGLKQLQLSKLTKLIRALVNVEPAPTVPELQAFECKNGVKQSWLAAQPAYALFGLKDRLGVNWTERPHGMVPGDWDALLAFADKFLLGKKLERRFDEFPAASAGILPAFDSPNNARRMPAPLPPRGVNGN